MDAQLFEIVDDAFVISSSSWVSLDAQSISKVNAFAFTVLCFDTCGAFEATALRSRL